MKIKYNQIMQDTVKAMSLNVSTMTENKLDQSISSGLLCNDLILGNGGWIPGWHTSAGFEQSSKCLKSNTIINTNKGFVTLGETVNKKGFKKVKNLSIATYEGMQDVSHTFSQKVSETITVKTKNGHSLTGTKNHPLMVITPELNFEWKNLEDVKIGDWLVSKDTSKSAMYGDSKVNKYQASVLGYLTANGRQSSFSSFDRVVQKRYSKVLKKGFGTKPQRKYIDGIVSGISFGDRNSHKSSVYKQLKRLGYCGDDSSKTIPYSIRTAPKKVLHEFLESYFECDSGHCGGRVKLVTASKLLVYQLKNILFFAYGIRSQYTTMSYAHNNNPTERKYQLYISGNDAKTFIATFKRAKVNHASDKITKHEGEVTKVIPFVRAKTMEIYNKCKVGTHPSDARYKSIDGVVLRNFKKPEYINRSLSGITEQHWASEYLWNKVDWDLMIPHIARIDKKLSKKLNEIRKGFLFEEVVSIKLSKGKTKVYDVTIPSNHTFIANGIISHNSTVTMLGMHSAYKNNLPIKQIWDYEHSFDPEYMRNFIWSTLEKDVYGKRHKSGKWKKEPSIWYFEENIAENFFDSMVDLLHKLPNKIKYDNNWFLSFENTRKNKATVGADYDKSLYQMTGRLCIPVDDGKPQGLIMLDSYPMMNPRRQDEKGQADGKMGGAHAAMFSQNIPRIKGMLTEKKIILLGINQFREKPGVMFGPSEYEACGNALRTNSDVRLKHMARAIPASYKNWGNKSTGQHFTETSIDGGIDTYRYISITIEKNKVGGSPKGTVIFQRIWVADQEGIAKGICPVFDCFQYLILTGQATGNLKKIKIDTKFKTSLNNKTLSLFQLKTLIVGNTKQKKAIAKKLGLDSNPKILSKCFEQIQSGKAYSLF